MEPLSGEGIIVTHHTNTRR